MKTSFRRYALSPQTIFTATGFLLFSIGLNSCSVATQAGGSRPTDAQVEAKVLQVIRNHPNVIFESVTVYQQKKQEQQQQAQKAFLQKMKANPKSVIGESPSTGASDQKIVLIEFSDFQCPHCATAYQTLKQFVASHQGEVTLVYKHLPLTAIHSEAMSAAVSAWAAGQQGKFWEFHDALYENQDKLGESLYVATAKALNLNLKQFNHDRNSSAASAAIQKDVQLAQEIGIEGTPMLAMNGEPINADVQVAELKALLTKVSKQ